MLPKRNTPRFPPAAPRPTPPDDLGLTRGIPRAYRLGEIAIMSSSPSPVGDLLRLALRHPLRWLLPAAVVGAAACGYAVVKRDTWEASQSMMVRAEAGNGDSGVGRFRDLAEMKTLQETIQEVAKSRAVLAAALQVVGPPANSKTDPAAWPAPQDIDDLAESLKIVPPKGTEFGSTEVFYLKVRDPSPERAAQLADVIGDQLLGRFRQIRQERARSMVAELDSAVELAREDLNDAVIRLKSLEIQVGGDLGELRNLEQQSSGEGVVRRLVVELESEIRQNESALRTQQELLGMLQVAKDDPARLPATPNRMLESQPALRRLKDGLIDAQLRTSQLLGGMSPEHPAVQSAVHAENEIRSHIRGELAAAVQGVEAEIAVISDVLADRHRRLEATRARLDRLAGMRAEYSTVNAETQHRLSRLEQAERRRVEARASQAGGIAADQLTKIGKPDVDTRPVGPGRTLIAGGGLLAGLLFGLGCLLLTAGAAGTGPVEGAGLRSPAPTDSTPAEVLPADDRTADAEPVEGWPVEAWTGAEPADAAPSVPPAPVGTVPLKRRTPHPPAEPAEPVAT